MLTTKRTERFQQVLSQRLQDVVVLENIHDPHNALAAIRNCDAFGIQTAHIVFETEKLFNPQKLGRATSSSANKWVDTKCWEKSLDCVQHLKRDGYHIIATIIDNKAKQLDGFSFPQQKSAIVFGNEGFGISDTIKKEADELVYIPMHGFVDSINLSVSVGVMLFELNKQRTKSNFGYMAKQEQEKLLKKWTDLEIKRKMRL